MFICVNSLCDLMNGPHPPPEIHIVRFINHFRSISWWKTRCFGSQCHNPFTPASFPPTVPRRSPQTPLSPRVSGTFSPLLTKISSPRWLIRFTKTTQCTTLRVLTGHLSRCTSNYYTLYRLSVNLHLYWGWEWS